MLRCSRFDQFVDRRARAGLHSGDNVETPIWDTYKEIVAKYDERGDKAVGNIERFAFYEEAKTAYCIISTSEKALYANIMLQKGVVINN